MWFSLIELFSSMAVFLIHGWALFSIKKNHWGYYDVCVWLFSPFSFTQYPNRHRSRIWALCLLDLNGSLVSSLNLRTLTLGMEGMLHYILSKSLDRFEKRLTAACLPLTVWLKEHFSEAVVWVYLLICSKDELTNPPGSFLTVKGWRYFSQKNKTWSWNLQDLNCYLIFA